MDTDFTPAQTELTQALHDGLMGLDVHAVEKALKAGANASCKLGPSELNAVHRLLWLDPNIVKSDAALLRNHTACFLLLLTTGNVKMSSRMVKKYNVYQALDGRWPDCAGLWIERLGTAKATQALTSTQRRNDGLMMDWWGGLLEKARTLERAKQLEHRLPKPRPGTPKPRM